MMNSGGGQQEYPFLARWFTF